MAAWDCHGLFVYRTCRPPANGVENCETDADRARDEHELFKGSGSTRLVWHLRRDAVTGLEDYFNNINFGCQRPVSSVDLSMNGACVTAVGFAIKGKLCGGATGLKRPSGAAARGADF